MLSIQKISVKSILVLLSIAFRLSLYAIELSYIEKYRWIRDTFAENDAGFQYIITRTGTLEYERHNRITEARLAEVEHLEEAVDIYREWLTFFRPYHHGVYINWDVVERKDKDQLVNTVEWEKYDITEEEFRHHLSTLEQPGYEGIWYSAPYTIGIIGSGEGYLGFVIDEVNTRWVKQQIKLQIHAEGVDQGGVWYMGDYSPRYFEYSELIGNNHLLLGRFHLKRLYPDFSDNKEDEEIALHYEIMSTVEPFLRELSDSSILIRFPSFDISQKTLIDQFLADNHELITSKENLIIDIRNNGGGSDMSFSNLIPYLYTNPIRHAGIEFLSTPLNNLVIKQKYAALEEGDDEEVREFLDEKIKELEENIGGFVNLWGMEYFDEEQDEILPYPAQVAIIINENVGSAAELLALQSKQSRKTKLFGKSTIGALDTSNMVSVTSPCEEIILYYCLSISLRVPGLELDGIGIQPDFFIDRSIPDYKWLEFVLKITEWEQ